MIDNKDKKILDLLRQDASLSTHKIAKQTLIPQTTVLHRISKLKREGIIRKYTLDIDFAKLGKNVKALIFVKVDKKLTVKTHGRVGKIESSLIKEDFILNIKRLMGKYDFVIEAICKDVKELDKLLHTKIRSIPSVVDTETIVVLNEWSDT